MPYMKRKRKSSSGEISSKRRKNASETKGSPTWPLLRQYYPRVESLRHYLASKLSAKRRKKIVQYGVKVTSASESELDIAFAALLDDTIVGSFEHSKTNNVDLFDKDLTVFTQQLSNSTATINSTQNVLNQSEVGFGPGLAAVLSQAVFLSCAKYTNKSP